MNKAFLLIGGNLGDRKKNLSDACLLINKSIGITIKESKIYETAAWGNTQQANFLNQVLLVNTNLSAIKLLAACLEIEKKLGRTRNQKWEARLMDIDILFFNQEIIKTETLIIPHPLMQDRKFVLVPLNEIASKKIHPIFRKTVGRLLKECEDELDVLKYN